MSGGLRRFSSSAFGMVWSNPSGRIPLPMAKGSRAALREGSQIFQLRTLSEGLKILPSRIPSEVFPTILFLTAA
jgi:hypothetical protein